MQEEAGSQHVNVYIRWPCCNGKIYKFPTSIPCGVNYILWYRYSNIIYTHLPPPSCLFVPGGDRLCLVEVSR